MDEILHHFEAMGNHLFVGIDRGIIILGLRRWCRILSTHSSFGDGISMDTARSRPRGACSRAPQLVGLFVALHRVDCSGAIWLMY